MIVNGTLKNKLPIPKCTKRISSRLEAKVTKGQGHHRNENLETSIPEWSNEIPENRLLAL